MAEEVSCNCIANRIEVQDRADLSRSLHTRQRVDLALPMRLLLYVRAKDVPKLAKHSPWTFQSKLQLATERVRWLKVWHCGPDNSFVQIKQLVSVRRIEKKKIKSFLSGFIAVSRLASCREANSDARPGGSRA